MPSRLLLIFVCFLCYTTAHAQPRPDLTNAYKNTYYYKISDDQAFKLCDQESAQPDSSYFSHLAYVQEGDSLVVLKPGNYLRVNMTLSGISYQYVPVTAWDIFIPNNGKDLIVQLTDRHTMKVLNKAEVFAGRHRVPYDDATQRYMLRSFKKEGVLSVKDASGIFYYNLMRDTENKRPYYNRRRHRNPLPYLLTLLQVYDQGIYDTYHSIQAGRPFGSISKLLQQQRRLLGKYNNRDSDYNPRSSYFFFSKPKYRQGDTIQFKAHLLNNKQETWYHRPLSVFIGERDDEDDALFLGMAYCPKKGAGYNFRFTIHDSMDIDLDDDYYIFMKDADSNVVGFGKFVYENYELKKAVFEIKLPEDETQKKGKPFYIHFTAKDENGLSMPDTRAALTLTTYSVNHVKPDQAFIPDTLWTHHIRISAGTDSLMIPDSIFPDADLKYALQVVMQNSENERTERNPRINYKSRPASLVMELLGDKIKINQTEQDTGKIHVYAKDRFGFQVMDTQITAPCLIPLQTNAATYHGSRNYDDIELDITEKQALVTLQSNRSSDSCFFFLENPRQIPVIYHLYKNKKEIRRGMWQDFPFSIAASERAAYSVSLTYVWAGKTVRRDYNPTLLKGKTNLLITQPPVITPGQEAEIQVLATDYRNKPIPGLNVLAYSYTAKFDQNKEDDYEENTQETLPTLGFRYKARNAHTSFALDHTGADRAQVLNYAFWNKKMLLDTNWAYRFSYPAANTFEVTEVAVEDSITQVAPFVMENGKPQVIAYVLIDNVPVYFGFTSHSNVYSFATDTRYHQLKIRTSKKLIVLDSIKVKAGCKSLFSIDQSQKSPRFASVNMPDTLTIEEQAQLYPYIMTLEMPAKSLRNAYMEADRFIDLSSSWVYSNNRLQQETVGPVTVPYWQFRAYQKFDRRFRYQPGYAYTFTSDLVKMRTQSIPPVPIHLSSGKIPDIQDEVLSRNKLTKSFEQRIEEGRRKESLTRLNQSMNGTTTLSIGFAAGQENDPINILLARPGDFNFLNIYSGSTRSFGKIAPGQYQIMLVDAFNRCRQTGMIEVKDHGYNFYRITRTDTLPDTGRATINAILNNLYSTPEDVEAVDLPVLMNAYARTIYAGRTTSYNGTIYDSRGETIPGASIKFEGTRIGTITDVDGYFEIDQPPGVSAKLVINALGYGEQKSSGRRNMKIILDQGDNILTEVSVVDNYGPPTIKQKYTGAADVITANGIYKMPVSELTGPFQGSAPGLQIVKGPQPGTGARVRLGNIEAAGSETMPLVVINGVPFNGKVMELDASLIAGIRFLKDEDTKKLYGARAANGVLFITIKEGIELPPELKAALQEAPPPMSEEMMVSSMRRNFRDDAYWQPDLVTDKNGKVSFKVKFPDDITRWKTIVAATDDKKHTGMVFGNIKAYKPVAAALYSPRFLLDGDTALLIGKSVNYLPDTINAATAFYRDSLLLQQQHIKLGPFYNDTLLLTASGADSVRMKYVLTKEDGYFDGEERSIPLQRVGTKIANGNFLSLDAQDTSFSITPFPGSASLHVVAMASLADVLDDEIEVLRDYGYLCNEQMASKILAFLSKEKIAKVMNRPFDPKDKRYVQGLIYKIVQNQNNDNLWGWWGNSSTVPWISAHVMNTLLTAKQAGYTCDLKNNNWKDACIFQLERDTSVNNIAILKLLLKANVKLDFEKYISRIESIKKLAFNDYQELVLLRQQLGLPYQLKRLSDLQQTDVFGNIYWQDTAAFVYNNEVITTINALKILERDTTTRINIHKITNWLLQQRGSQGWRNTYESALIIDVLSNSIPMNNTVQLKPSLQITGGLNKTVNTFPMHLVLPSQTGITVHKTGSLPVYCSWYYNTWDTGKTRSGNNFKVDSWFEADKKTITYLPAGMPVNLKVSVVVEKSAEYVMIEIPIPAGCSYQDKEQSYYSHEIHREYFDNRVSIFCDKLPKGRYEFEVTLLPRYAGNYTLNPAKAELMYFPVFYGKEGLKKIKIKH